MTIRTVRAVAAAMTLTLWIAAVDAAQDRPAPTGSDLDRAQAAFDAGRYTEALGLARRAANAAPTSARAQTVRAAMAECLREPH